MIALPEKQMRRKMTTPKEAATSLGISPIGSARNVMVKVKDTPSFIEKSITIHGDKYDYSQTCYLGAQFPITIICKKCGPFTLAQAGTHYGKKACGCRCEGNRKYKTCECGFTGYGTKDFPYSAKGKCSKCAAEERQLKRTVGCRGCGVRFKKSHKKTYCSHECRVANKPKTFEVKNCSCVACGKEVTRKVYFSDYRNVLVCSMKCQNEWALFKNRGCLKKDWVKASLKKKTEWKTKNAIRRGGVSIQKKWWQLCKAKKWFFDSRTNEWHLRCKSSANGIDQRIHLHSVGRLRSRICSWTQLCERVVVKKIDYACLEEWSRKCYSTCKNMKWKRRLRNVKLNTWKHTESAERQQKQLLFWELIDQQRLTN